MVETLCLKIVRDAVIPSVYIHYLSTDSDLLMRIFITIGFFDLKYSPHHLSLCFIFLCLSLSLSLCVSISLILRYLSTDLDLLMRIFITIGFFDLKYSPHHLSLSFFLFSLSLSLALGPTRLHPTYIANYIL